MFKKLFNGESKTITSAAIILAAASILGQGLGILRDRILAGEFGAGSELDIYYAAFRIPDLVFNLIVLGALSAGFIPVFSSYLGNKKKAWELANLVVNVMLCCLVIISSVLIILAPYLLKLIAPGFSANELQVATGLTRIMFLSPIFLGISGVLGSILQSFKRFFIYSLAPIVYNIGIIIGALLFTKFLGLYGLAWGVVFGALMHMLIQMPAVFSLGYNYQFKIDLNHQGLRKILTMMVPRTIGLVVSQINFFIVTIIGSTLAAGSIAIFNLANNIQSFPLSLFGVTYAIAAFPTLSELAAHKKRFIQTFSLVTRQILFFIVPSTALLIVLRAQVVRAILGSGRFDWEDTVLTLQVVTFFAISLFAQSLILVLARAFYARHDSKTPLYTSLISAIANIVFSIYFARDFGVVGLSLAFSLASILNFILLFLILHYRLGSLDGQKITISTGKILIATFMLGIVAQAVKYPIEQKFGTSTFVGIAIQAAAACSAGLIIYFFICWLLKSEELNLFVESIKKKLLKHPEIPQEIIEQEKIST
jgi:putative peptidoglycan lipid II flippase